MTVAKVIEFYIPNNFRKSVKWVSPEQRGKIVEFVSQPKKSAWQTLRAWHHPPGQKLLSPFRLAVTRQLILNCLRCRMYSTQLPSSFTWSSSA